MEGSWIPGSCSMEPFLKTTVIPPKVITSSSSKQLWYFSMPWPSRCRRVGMSGGRGGGEGGNENKSEHLPLESIESTLVTYRPQTRYPTVCLSPPVKFSVSPLKPVGLGPGNPSVCVCTHHWKSQKFNSYTTNYNTHTHACGCTHIHIHTLLMEHQ